MPVIHEVEGGPSIVHCTSPSELEPFRASFVAAYRRIFAGAPYHEEFSAAEASDVLDQLAGSPGSLTLIAVHQGEVVAFGMAVPLMASARVRRVLTGIVPVKATMYLAELGVDPAWRRQRLGKLLVKLRLQLIDRDLFTHAVLRVADGRTSSFEMYRSMGFGDTGVSMVVHRRRTDGEVRGDTRHFLARVISQVDLGD